MRQRIPKPVYRLSSSWFRRLVAIWCSVGLSVLLVAGPALADVEIQNRMVAEWTGNDTGVSIYPYGSGQQHVADFSTGTHSGTVNNAGSLELGGPSGDWWDTAWSKRQCFDVKSSDAVAEYPLRFEVDTSGTTSDGDDIRVVEAATNTLLTSYSEGLFPDAASVVWAQAEPLPAGVSSYCVYFENSSAPNVSDEVGTFTYTTGQAIKYYTMFDIYDGAGNDSRVTVRSYSANNSVTADGSAPVVLGVGGTATFSGLDKDSVITATGPISASYDRPSKESLLPESFADTQFTFPTSRHTQRFWVRSPNGTTTIEAVVDGAVVPAASVTVTPGDGSVEINAEVTGNDFVSLRSTDGTKFLAVHGATNDLDSMLGIPWYNDTLYGVASTRLEMGAIADTTVSWVSHDGGSNAAQAVPRSARTRINGNGSYGDGRAYAITGTGASFHAIQQADGDGNESTSFFPQRLLAQTYRLPIDARYYTIACPVVGTSITVNGVAAGTCNGVGVGHFYGGFGNHPAGTLIESDHPVFVYFEGLTSRDETNIFGAKGAIPYVEEHKWAADPVEMLPPQCGTWLSAPMASSGVFGLVMIDASLPAGTSATYQVSTDGSAFYGVDGTTATSFSDGDIMPYLADGASTIQFRIELCTTDMALTPSVASFSVECDLNEVVSNVSNVDSLSVASSATTETTPLLRVYQRTPDVWQAWLEHSGGANLAATDVTFTTDTPTTQVSVLSGVVSDPRPPFIHQDGVPYSVFATHTTAAGQQSQVVIVLVDEADVRIENHIEVGFVG